MDTADKCASADGRPRSWFQRGRRRPPIGLPSGVAVARLWRRRTWIEGARSLGHDRGRALGRSVSTQVEFDRPSGQRVALGVDGRHLGGCLCDRHEAHEHLHLGQVDVVRGPQAFGGRMELQGVGRAVRMVQRDLVGGDIGQATRGSRCRGAVGLRHPVTGAERSCWPKGRRDDGRMPYRMATVDDAPALAELRWTFLHEEAGVEATEPRQAFDERFVSFVRDALAGGRWKRLGGGGRRLRRRHPFRRGGGGLVWVLAAPHTVLSWDDRLLGNWPTR